MRITADTNILVRAIAADHPRQSRVAAEELAAAELVAIPSAALCELVWVLQRGYDATIDEIGQAIRLLLASVNVVADRPAAEAGLAMLQAGGDFADGVIAFAGNALGGEAFVSFDKDAVRRLQAQGQSARLLR